MCQISVVGSANIDMTATVQKFPKPGETLVGKTFETFCGGKGANQAISASRLGGDVSFLGRVGDDSFGTDIIENFKCEEVNISFLERANGCSTGTALILVDSKGENKIVIIPGANHEVTEGFIAKNESVVSGADIALAQLEIPMDAVVKVADVAKKNHTRFVLDPAPAQEIPKDLLRDLFLITPNQSEIENLTGITANDRESARNAAQVLHNRGVRNVIITLGGEGAFLSTQETSSVVRAPSVQVRDTTGAGDVFNGALAVALCRQSEWKAAIEFACEAASRSVLKEGAQESIPFESDIDTLKTV